MASNEARIRRIATGSLSNRFVAAFCSRQKCVDEGAAYSLVGLIVPDRPSSILVDLAIAYGVLKSYAPDGELRAEEIFRGVCEAAAELPGARSLGNAPTLSRRAKALYATTSKFASIIDWQNFLEEYFLPVREGQKLSKMQIELRRAVCFVFALDSDLFKDSLLAALGYELNHSNKVEEREQHAYLVYYKYGYVNQLELGFEPDAELASLGQSPTHFGKRLMDITLASMILLMTLPLFITIALIQAFDDGPLFYGQRRIGLGGSMFRCWKFRTMVPNAEAALKDILERDAEARAEWARYEKLRNDPRITRIGKFLRRTSLDELPQLFNVLSGEMSLVGPRPMALHERDRWGHHYRLYKRVRPGVTGPWQIRHRTDSDYETRISCLNQYVEEWSILKDLVYIVLTIKVPFSGIGAY